MVERGGEGKNTLPLTVSSVSVSSTFTVEWNVIIAILSSGCKNNNKSNKRKVNTNTNRQCKNSFK